MSSLGLLAEEKTRKVHGRRVSEETVYSVHSSSNGFSSGQRGIAVNGTGSFLPRRNLRSDTIAFKSGNSYVAQRVLSAKVLRFKELQNELQEVKNQLHEVMNENKLLRNLQKRQDTALSRYEDSSAALPRLLENHQAEVNTLKAHAREVRAAARSLHRKLQRSENELLNLRDEHEKLLKIAEDKDLEGRSQLQKRIEELEDRLNEMKDKNIALSRKMEIEQKSHSQQMNTEIAKRKALSKELQSAINEISRLSLIAEHHKTYVNSGGDNESSTNLILRSSKFLSKKPVSQRNPICSKNHTGNAKITKISDSYNKLKNEVNEKDKDELNQDFHIPLENKSSNESMDLNPLLAQNIVNGLDLTADEYLQTDKKETTTDDKNFSYNKTEVSNLKNKKCDSTDENEKERPVRLSSSNGENYSWYDEAYSDKSKIDFSSTPSRTSCDVNESKSSTQSDRHESSYIPKEVQNELSDSTEEEEKIKLTIKKERYRSMVNRKSQSSDASSHDNVKETIESSNNEKQKSSRHKTMKNNLRKIQDHLNKFDEGVDTYLEEKSIRNKNSPYADITEKGVKKHENFNDYIKKLEEIDRLNESLIVTSQKQEHGEKVTSDDDDGFYAKGSLDQDAKDIDISSENRKFRKNISEIDLKEMESDKFLEEINTSYKMIRSRMDAENEIMNKKLQEYCKDVAGDVQAANDAIDQQKQNLERNRRETEMIEQAMRTNSKITENLKFGGRIDSSKKTQLLAALKAIDCGKDVNDLQKPTSSSGSTELIEPSSTSLNSSRRMNKKQIMKELFD